MYLVIYGGYIKQHQKTQSNIRLMVKRFILIILNYFNLILSLDDVGSFGFDKVKDSFTLFLRGLDFILYYSLFYVIVKFVQFVLSLILSTPHRPRLSRAVTGMW